MTEQSQLHTCKICGKKMEKLGFHVRKKHMMSMAEYQNWNAPTPEKQTFDITDEPVQVQQTIKAEEPRKQPWYKKFFFCLNKLIG